ncbi:hypothetical protein RND71_012364 [Anisodus tanguticus]|uniref:VWFA domain-containing protein n=1 Tax=Anisodus tanguticus TaxID=243964 RepID=A0AAE1VGW2_9SOLA|nr:hypothetical protein RND71_012364 [Anisodus tanguticus]
MDDDSETEKVAKIEDGRFLKPQIFTLTISQVDGGTNISVTIRWSQKLLYCNGQLTLDVPFSFPEFVTPVGKKISKKEKIQLNVNSGRGTEVMCKTTSHPLKERQRQAVKLGFFYESDVLNWSSGNFVFSYTVFRKEVVFIVDISGSMKEKPIEDTKKALCTALPKLDSQDLFNIIAFNSENYLFSSSLELATKKAIENATQWIGTNFIAGGGTNILNPDTGHGDVSYTQQHIPIIFLVTDGAVEDERHICDVLKGLFCNHYFLHMLAMMRRGHYNALMTYCLPMTISLKFVWNSCSPGHHPSFLRIFPLRTLMVLKNLRYRRVFPETLKAKGVLADLSNFSLDLNIPLDKVLARQQVELLTAQAWLTENKDLEQKIAQTSIQNDVISEYTHMILIETDRGKVVAESTSKRKVSTAPKKIGEPKLQKKILLQNLGVGFGDCSATVEKLLLESLR